MFCKNCGKEIADTAKFCDGCGQDFSKPTESKNTFKSLLSKVKQNKIILGGMTAIIVSLIVGLFVILNLPNKPNVEQIKADFTTQILGGEDIIIKEINIISKTDTNKNQYRVIADIIFNDKVVEEQRQYEFVYFKSKAWSLNTISPIKENEWKKYPILVPDIDKCKNACVERLKENNQYIYDVFEFNEKNTKTDFEKGTSQLVFSVNKSTDILEVSGEIQFIFNFNYNKREWDLISYSHLDSYKVNTKLVRQWQGTTTHKTSGTKENFVLNVKEFDFSTNAAEVELQFKGNTYKIGGAISISEFQKNAEISATSVEDQIKIYMCINQDGLITQGSIQTRVHPKYSEGWGYYDNDAYTYSIKAEAKYETN